MRGLGMAAAAALALGACGKASGPAAVTKGAAVRLNYTLSVDGRVVETSVGKEPLNYVQGSGQLMPGLEDQLEGLKAGDKKEVTVPPEKGYGLVDPAAVQKVPKAAFPNLKDLKPGVIVGGQAGGRPFKAVVKSVGDKDVTLDMNHPLAGKTLVFDVEVLDVKAAK